ncbi:mechanosensitive ion channel family protein [Mucilaginibacter segetis]|uniref:Mechanosensitive ion channel family protein n=1 Tax=Mucilaginibacter segetis TaxID=2793071 RepID=A0A934PPN6_9SPHI|nr:mechanosensitive ion channel family protein [Mucilaginibacter segetis]MBK0378423.1 mechanosensitive ion channel family protein [Mucilaginibacter segetis]
MEQQLKEFLFNPTIGKIVTLLVGTAIIWVIIKSLQKNLFSRIKSNENSYKAKKLSNFIGYLLTLVLITVIYSDKLGGLTIALGVAGAGIAFALQEVIASFAGWLMIMFGGFYKTGDRVQLGGIKGDVMDIGVLRTTIMETGQWVEGDLYNGRIVLIANSFVFKEPVFNYSGDFPFLWDEIKVHVQYGSDYDQVRSILLAAGNSVAGDLTELLQAKWNQLQNKYRLEEAQTAPMVSLVASDSCVDFTLRYVVNYKKRRFTKTALFTQILKAVDNSDGKVRFASATFELVSAPELQVNLNK